MNVRKLAVAVLIGLVCVGCSQPAANESQYVRSGMLVQLWHEAYLVPGLHEWAASPKAVVALRNGSVVTIEVDSRKGVYLTRPGSDDRQLIWRQPAYEVVKKSRIHDARGILMLKVSSGRADVDQMPGAATGYIAAYDLASGASLGHIVLTRP